MDVVYSCEPFPERLSRSLFLAGPSPRSDEDPNWREAANSHLVELGYDGVAYVPLTPEGKHTERQAEFDWERRALDSCDVIVFWIPRDLERLPGFTTNIEVGHYIGRRNVVLGFPKGTPKTRYLERLAAHHRVQVCRTLSETLEAALGLLGEGAERVGGEIQVPLHVWRLPHFRSWLTAQKAAGNRLDGFDLRLTHWVANGAFLLYWAAQVDLHVAAEKRNKSNEIVVGRPDVKHVVCLRLGSDLESSQVVLVREFRSTGNTSSGFVVEAPGGSSFREEKARETAVAELREEVGLEVEPDRFVPIGARQLASTSVAHRAHAFALSLTPDELSRVSADHGEGRSAGEPGSSEITYPEVYAVSELLAQEITDWSCLGMILAAHRALLAHEG